MCFYRDYFLFLLSFCSISLFYLYFLIEVWLFQKYFKFTNTDFFKIVFISDSYFISVIEVSPVWYQSFEFVETFCGLIWVNFCKCSMCAQKKKKKVHSLIVWPSNNVYIHLNNTYKRAQVHVYVYCTHTCIKWIMFVVSF